MNYLLDAAGASSSIFWVFIVLGIVLLFIMSSSRNKKDLKAREELNNSIKEGAKVITAGGIYATVEKVTDTTAGKVVLLSSGEGSKVSYFEIHINAIAGIDTKQPVLLDEHGNIIDSEKIAEDIISSHSDNITSSTSHADDIDSFEKGETNKKATKKSKK